MRKLDPVHKRHFNIGEQQIVIAIGGAETSAMLFVIGRAAYALLYYSGVSFIRVPAFVLGTLSTFYIAYGLLVSL